MTRVQALTQDIGAIRIRGERLAADITAAIHGSVPVKRTIDGASTVELTLSDPDGRFRRHRIFRESSRIAVDGLAFRLVKISKQGQDLKLTAEDELAWAMRQKHGPKKALRANMTRARFIAKLARAAYPRARIIAPGVDERQPIETEKQGRQATRERDQERKPGFGPNAHLTVKGNRASKVQIEAGARALAVANSLNAPRRAQVALMVGCIIESEMGTVGMTVSTDADSLGILQVRAGLHGADVAKSIEKSVSKFLKDGFAGAGGAISLARSGGGSAGEIAIKALAPSSAYHHRYLSAESEASEWVDAYNGAESIDSSVEVQSFKPYAFKVERKEDFWEASGRLVEEVNWRRFSIATERPTLFIADDITLLRSRPRLVISDLNHGINDVDWDCDTGKRVHEATVTARGKTWTAPPGTVVELDDSHGEAEGRWLVHEINSDLTHDDIDVSLKRPSRPLPEPAPESVTRSVNVSGRGASSGGAGSTSVQRLVRWAEKTVGTQEGSERHRKWASALGYDTSLPWCSIWLGYGLREVCGLELPSNPAYSGAWLEWSGGRQVSAGEIQAGDLVIYDWGDGGITDHIALAVGGSTTIGGNESNRVAENTIKQGNIVGVVRPNYA